MHAGGAQVASKSNLAVECYVSAIPEAAARKIGVVARLKANR